MKILFVHQNFPGQFKHLAPTLAELGHDVKALAINKNPVPQGVHCVHYTPLRGNEPKVHPWLLDMESKVIRGEAAYFAARRLKADGFDPDIIIAHPGWGEALFLKDVWPQARLGLYAEFYYQAQGSDVNFDPEFLTTNVAEACRLRIKNAGQDLQFAQADLFLSPTQFQASVFPADLQSKISVIHDGIDTQHLTPSVDAELKLNNSVVLNKQCEVITFVNRNLEPMRGYHIFIRALPEILSRRPKARIIIVGGDGVSYGAKPPKGKSWKNIFLDEVRDQIDMSRVHFVGKVSYPNFIKLLQLSSVHVYLTYPFVLSWSLLEAMSIGCAIVASDTAPVSEVIAHNKTGRLVDFFDREALAAQVINLLECPTERERLGNAAREFAIHNYDLKNVCLPKQMEWVQKLARKG
ncbi:glycosyltransferase family 4 protein [Cellvibrio sp.]|uniref:glycosyltransferase family 4 protein n=1 Tax=Cellvibrio sp. TaxID=1965322 RepID=UPI0039648AA3